MTDRELDAFAARLAPTTAMLNSRQLARIFGWKTTWTLKAIKIAAKATNDSPFIGYYATVADVRKWLKRHPDFVAAHHMRHKLAAPGTDEEPRTG